MSLASDRAEAIAAWTKTNGRRLVFLMPRDFTCRIVALSPESELLAWLDNQGAKFIGEFGADAKAIQRELYKAGFKDEALLCKCGNERVEGGPYCKSCASAQARKYRQSHPLTAEQRIKMNSRSYANTYQRRGKIIKQPCQNCGSQDSQKHHPDYQRPLEVIWLCRKCHLDHHKAVVSH